MYILINYSIKYVWPHDHAPEKGLDRDFLRPLENISTFKIKPPKDSG